MTSPKYHQNLLYLPASLYKAQPFFQNGGYFSPETKSSQSCLLRTETVQAGINKVSINFLHALFSLLADRDLLLPVFWWYYGRIARRASLGRQGPGNRVARAATVKDGHGWSPNDPLPVLFPHVGPHLS